ncbi:MAG: MFS transporter [Candidatus Bathyarchaeota archaeon]|jgi:predicted MFS family arabinose efflux permease|nr:MFS transporter [Candidatus Bathyarchaeota archaeon]MCW3992331.1 MFS transporter [Candidatus Bathyarchaeota archaeon]
MGSEGHARFMIPSLTLAVFATQPCETILSLLLIDIAETFKTQIGTMGQIRTTAGLLTLVTALILGVLSMWINHRTLLLTGLGFFIVSGVGCVLAQDYTTMLAAYSLSGIGLAMVGPMSLALIGEYVPLERRADAVGYVTAGGASSFLIGGPVLSFVTRFGGWRSAFLLYMLPVAIIGVALTWIGVPSSPSSSEAGDTGSYLEGIRQVMTNRSAIACLLGGLLAKATWQGVLSYGISFYREWYQLSKGWASLLLSGLALSFIISALLGGRLVNRFGRKTTTFYSFLMVGVFSILYMNSPLYWLSLAVFMAMGVMSGIRRNASQSLALEQVPTFRGSMMSLNTAGDNLGSVLGAGIGGAMLMTSDYNLLGVVLGLLGVLSALVIKLFASDPTGG